MHLTDGSLRMAVDGETVALEHLTSCKSCRSRHDRIASNAAFVARAFNEVSSETVGVAQRSNRVRRRPARYAWLMIIIAFGIGVPLATAARSFLVSWTPEAPLAVGLSHDDFERYAHLGPYSGGHTGYWEDAGKVEEHVVGVASRQRVINIDTASRRAGFSVVLPGVLPNALEMRPSFIIRPAFDRHFRFDAQTAAAVAKRDARVFVPFPPGLNGTLMEWHVPAAVLLTFAAVQPPHAPRLTVVEQKRPDVLVAGADARSIVRYMTEREGLSPAATKTWLDAATDIRAIPTAYELGAQTATEVSIRDARGLLIEDARDLSGSVVWTNAGFIYSITGPYPGKELIEVARSLRTQ
jgi:hypothetical protein